MCVCVSFSLLLRAVAGRGVVCVRCGGGGGRGGREDTNRTIWEMIPAKVSLKGAETEQLYQAQRMFGGIGNVLLSTFPQTENGEDPLVSLVNL